MINIFRNAMFGDGHIGPVNTKQKVQLRFMSTQQSNIEFKCKFLNSNLNTIQQHKNAFGTKLLYTTNKSVPVENLNKMEQINNLSIDDFYLWLIDDGSFHKTKHFMNLNSHALSKAENEELQSYLKTKFNFKTTVYTDKKKDGRIFYYLNIPVVQTRKILPEFKKFIIINNLYGYEYKVGETSQTIGLSE